MRRRSLVQLLLLVLIGGAAYLPSFDGDFYLDDQSNILQADHLEDLSPSSIRRSLASSPMRTRPVSNFTLALDYYLHQTDTFFYHLFNLTVHLACAVLLLLIFSQVLRHRFDEKEASWLALCGALLWVGVWGLGVYILDRDFDQVLALVKRIEPLAIALSVMALLAGAIYIWRRNR